MAAASLASCGQNASPIDLPQVQNAGGPVLDTPTVISVTFPSPDGGADPLASMADAFVGSLPGTAFSRAAQEYGVKSLIAGSPIHSSLQLGAMVDDALWQDRLASELAQGLDGFSTPPAEALYILFIPPGVAVTASGQTGCFDFGGYHSAISISGRAKVAYAVVARCPGGFNDESEADSVTAVASHEILEAATDPYYWLNDGAWATVDNSALAFGLLFGGEIADLCLDSVPAVYTPPDLPYVVQRTWSNAAARADQDPCIPPPTSGEPFFQSSPELPSATEIKFDGAATQTAGLSLAVGQSITIPVDLYSASPTNGPWALNVLPLSSGTVKWSLDRDAGGNGEQVHLTLTLEEARRGAGRGRAGSRGDRVGARGPQAALADSDRDPRKGCVERTKEGLTAVSGDLERSSRDPRPDLHRV